MHKRMIWFLIVLWTVGFQRQLSAADIFIKQQIRPETVNRTGQIQIGGADTAEVWLTYGRVSISSREFKTVLDWQKRLLMIADHGKKTVMQIPLDFDRPFEQAGAGSTPQERAELQARLGQIIGLKVSVQPTEERRTIGRWQCRKYMQTIELGAAKVRMEIWATPEMAVDEELYSIYGAALFAQLPGMGPNLEALAREMKKITGVYVMLLQQTEMMGQIVINRLELLECREGVAPPEAFTVPAGYRKQAL